MEIKQQEKTERKENENSNCRFQSYGTHLLPHKI